MPILKPNNLTTRLLFIYFCLAGALGQITAQRSRTSRPRSPSSTAPKTARALLPEELAVYALPAVGLVVCSDGQYSSQGSGFFISPGLLVTNYHVIRGMTAGSVRVEVAKQQLDMRIARVLGYDDHLDLAFLWVPDAMQPKVQSLKLLERDDIRVGETIYALGNPEGLVGTFSPGIISAQERKVRNVSYMQISAPISRGSSGGPVINSRGEVIAVVVGSIEEGQNLNFAIPAKYVRAMLPQVASNQSQPSTDAALGEAWTWSKKPIEIRAKELVMKGDTQVQSGKLDDALASYNEALALSPNMVEAKIGVSTVYEEQGAALTNSGKYAEAVSLLKHSMPSYAANHLTYFELGRAYSLLKQRQNALEAFDTAITLKPDFALAHYAKGLMLIALDKLEAALDEVSVLNRLDAKLAADLFDFLSKTTLSSKLALLRQELESQGTFSTPSQSGSVSMTQMRFFVPRSFSGCEISWRQSSATVATNYSSSAMMANYTDFEFNLKDIDPDRIRSDRTNAAYYLYLPTRSGRTSIKRTNVMWLPDSRGKYSQTQSSDSTFSASIPIKNLDAADEVIKAFRLSALICSQLKK